MDLYNTFFDTTVDPSDIAVHGEFAGYTEIYSRVRLKKFIQSLPLAQNKEQAFKTSNPPIATEDTTSSGYFVPDLTEKYENISPLDTNWSTFFGFPVNKDSNQRTHYHVTVVYCRIIPSDFGIKVPGQDTPQVWKFIVVNNQVIIYSEMQTNHHDLLPIVFADPNDSGLAFQGKSLLENVQPFQSIVTALANSDIASRRRALSDRLAYDANRINPSALRPGIAHIPVKPSAAGTPVGNAIHQIPFEDSQFQFNTALMNQYASMASNVTGINAVRQGQFVKGNKTKREFETVMGNATGRDKLMSRILEASFFAPIKEIIKFNILQFQPSKEVRSNVTSETMRVNRNELAEAAVTLKMSDGLTPNERLIDADVLQSAMQTMAQAPDIGAGYNLTDLFSYLMKSAGADLRPFEKPKSQLAYEQAMGAWQQAVQAAAAQISNALQKMEVNEISEELLQRFQSLIPPQPLPEQFGYVPGQSNLEARGLDEKGKELSVMDQLARLRSAMLGNNEGAP